VLSIQQTIASKYNTKIIIIQAQTTMRTKNLKSSSSSAVHHDSYLTSLKTEATTEELEELETSLDKNV
jgi:hypothetical protein